MPLFYHIAPTLHELATALWPPVDRLTDQDLDEELVDLGLHVDVHDDAHCTRAFRVCALDPNEVGLAEVRLHGGTAC